MNILIDIGHPAHVHLFKNLAWGLNKNGHDVLFSVREKEMNRSLLVKYNFDFKIYGQSYKGIMKKMIGLFLLNIKLFKIIKSFSPDITISHGSFYLSQMSWLLKIKNITLEDTGNMEQIRLYKPFTNVILSPSCYKKYHGRKHVFYKGYHELAYLHPNRFNPNKYVLSLAGINDEPFVIMRFVSWSASHDYKHKGVSLENKLNAIKEFSKYTKVFISSEKELPYELKSYKLNIPSEFIHDLLAYATLVWGESATMVSEAAVLGIPGIYLDNTGRYYTQEQEKNYRIVFNFSESNSDQLLAINKGKEILQSINTLNDYKLSRDKLLEEKIDVSAFLVWFVEEFPASFKILKNNPQYPQKFV